MKRKKKKSKQDRIKFPDDPAVVGFYDGLDGVPPRGDGPNYMHGYNNGAVDAMRMRGELDHVKIV
jgi:hypothetical protein